MTTSNYITRTELREELQEALKPISERLDRREELQEALKPINERLDRIEEDLKHVRGRTNQIYDVLEKHGLPMVTEGDDR